MLACAQAAPAAGEPRAFRGASRLPGCDGSLVTYEARALLVDERADGRGTRLVVAAEGFTTRTLRGDAPERLRLDDALADFGDRELAARASFDGASLVVVGHLRQAPAACAPAEVALRLAPSDGQDVAPLAAALAVDDALAGAPAAESPAAALERARAVHAACVATLGAAAPRCARAAQQATVRGLAARRPPAELVETMADAAATLAAALGETHARTLDAQRDLAAAYRRSERLPDAARTLSRALEQYTARIGGQHAETLQVRLDLSEVERVRGNGAAAVDHARFAYDSMRTAGAAEGDVLDAVTALGHALAVDYRAEEAIALLEPPFALHRDAIARGQGPMGLAEALVVAYSRGGRDARMLDVVEVMLEAHRARGGERTPAGINALGTKAFALLQIGRLDEALPLMERTLELALATEGERSRYTVLALFNLATTYMDLGRFTEALAMSRRAHELAVAVYGETYLLTVRIQLAIGEAAMAAGEPAQAEAAMRRALDLYREHYGTGHPQTHTARLVYARLFAATGRGREAVALFEEAWQGHLRSRGAQHYGTLAAQSDYAAARTDLGDAGGAALQQEAFEALEASLGGRHPITLRALRRLADARARAGLLPESLDLYRRYIDRAESLRAAQTLSGSNRQSLFAALSGAYREAAVVAARAGNASLALDIAESAKARTLVETLAGRRAVASAGLPVAAIDRLRELEARLASAQSQLALLAAQPERRALAEASVNAIVREAHEYRVALGREFPKFAALAEVPLVDARWAAERLPPGTAALHFVLSERDAVGIVAVRGRPPVARALGDSASLVQLAGLYRRFLATPPGGAAPVAWWRDGVAVEALARPEGATRRASVDDVARALARRLLEPFARELAASRHWVVLPDGVLAGVPIEPLPWRGARVLDRHDVGYAQSLSVYAQVDSRLADYRSQHRPLDLLAVGAPRYESGAATKVAPATYRAAAQQLGGGAVLSSFADAGYRWSALPESQREIDAAVALFPRSTALTGTSADEGELEARNRRGELAAYRIVLLSAHGFAAIDAPSLSAVVLSQPPLGPADGFVTAAEWPAYDLRSDLVVLSACETGLGRPVAGEGVIGLPYAMFVAGNANAILTLWNVADRSARIASIELLRRVRAGMPPAQALAEAKRALARREAYRSPFFWAPFVLYGA